MLKCTTEELDLFWNLARFDHVIIEKRLGEAVPKKYEIHLM